MMISLIFIVHWVTYFSLREAHFKVFLGILKHVILYIYPFSICPHFSNFKCMLHIWKNKWHLKMKDDLFAASHLTERRLRKACEFQHLFVVMTPVIRQEEKGPAWLLAGGRAHRSIRKFRIVKYKGFFFLQGKKVTDTCSPRRMV